MLVEPQIPYDYLIRVMDVVRSADIEAHPAVVDGEPQQVALSQDGREAARARRVVSGISPSERHHEELPPHDALGAHPTAAVDA